MTADPTPTPEARPEQDEAVRLREALERLLTECYEVVPPPWDAPGDYDERVHEPSFETCRQAAAALATPPPVPAAIDPPGDSEGSLLGHRSGGADGESDPLERARGTMTAQRPDGTAPTAPESPPPVPAAPPDEEWDYDRLPTPPEQLREAEILGRMRQAARVAACPNHDNAGPVDEPSGFPTCSKCGAILTAPDRIENFAESGYCPGCQVAIDLHPFLEDDPNGIRCPAPREAVDALLARIAPAVDDLAEHRLCGPKFDGCYSHFTFMAHCRADGMAWPCDVERFRNAVEGGKGDRAP